MATAFSVTYPRSKSIDYTFPFSDDPMAILIPYPRLDSTISGIVRPFQYEVNVETRFTLTSIFFQMNSQIPGVDWHHL